MTRLVLSMAKSGTFSRWTVVRVLIGFVILIFGLLWPHSSEGYEWIETHIVGSDPLSRELFVPAVAFGLTGLLVGIGVVIMVPGLFSGERRTERRRVTRPSQREIIYIVEEEDDWLEPLRDYERRLKEFDGRVFDSMQSSGRRRKRRKSKEDDDWLAPMRDFKF